MAVTSTAMTWRASVRPQQFRRRPHARLSPSFERGERLRDLGHRLFGRLRIDHHEVRGASDRKPVIFQIEQPRRALAERRLAHFVELCETGWKRYFSEEDFLRRMREAMAVSARWAEIAPIPDQEEEQRAAA